MSLTYFLLGFAANLLTGLDDIITGTAVLLSTTRTRTGRVMFSMGIILSSFIVVAASFIFASFLLRLTYHKYLVASLLLITSALVFSGKISPKFNPKKAAIKKMSAKRALTLFGIGSFFSLATYLDDFVAYTPLFASDLASSLYAGAGIISATVFEAVLLVLFAGRLSKIKYRKEISASVLLLLAVFVITGVL